MTNYQPFFQLLGLANRARKVVSGEELVLNEIRKQAAKLVILAADASEATHKKFRDKCKYYKIKCVQVGDREALGQAIGKQQRVVLAVTDEGFAAKLLVKLGQ